MIKRAGRKTPTQAALADSSLIPRERIERAILVLRGVRVMLDADLAAFYGVSTKRLNEQVKRNSKRFPADFVFQLDSAEAETLRSQIVTSNDELPLRSQNATLENSTFERSSQRGRHRKYRPYVFTEHGAIMAATILNSERAVQVSVLVVRAFVRLRQILADHRDLARRVEALEREFAHKTDEHEAHIQRIYELLEELMNPPESPKKGRIGFAALSRS